MTETQNTVVENTNQNEYSNEKNEIVKDTDYKTWCIKTEMKLQQCAASTDVMYKDFSLNFLSIINPNIKPIFDWEKI